MEKELKSENYTMKILKLSREIAFFLSHYHRYYWGVVGGWGGGVCTQEILFLMPHCSTFAFAVLRKTLMCWLLFL